MKAKTLRIIVILVVCFASQLFSENHPSDFRAPFIVKIEGGGTVIDAIQTKDGNYGYLTKSSGPGIEQVMNASGKTISEISIEPWVALGPGFPILSLAVHGMAQTSNGFVLVGDVQEPYSYTRSEAVVVKIDSGKVQLDKYSAKGVLDFDSVSSTADGGFIIAGWTGLGVEYPVLIKFSSQGDVLWAKKFDMSLHSWSSRSTPTLDGGIILAADVIGTDGKAAGANVIKIDDSGNKVWAVTLKTEEFSIQTLTALSNQRYLIAGKATNPNRVLFVTLNADGTFHSKAAYSMNVPDFYISGLVQTPDNGIAIAGTLLTKSGRADDGFFLKINKRQLTFQKKLGFKDSGVTISSMIAQEDGSFLLFGSKGSDTLLIRLSGEGSVPGCSFSHDFSASKLSFGSLEHQNLRITLSRFRVTEGEKFVDRIEGLHRRIANVCVN